LPHWRFWLVSLSPVSAVDRSGHPLVLVVLHDVTEQWTTRARLDREAREDPLTGLINRGELLRQLAALDTESGGPHVGVIFLDLDGFKLVNDTRGHQVGDELLVAVARRIRAAVRPEDCLARIGGDEFVVLCPRLADPQDVRAVAERVRATLDEPVSIEGRAHRISMSLGISLARARAVVGQRERISHFVDVGNFRNYVGETDGAEGGDAGIATSSSYFFVRGQIRLARADMRMEALVRRSAQPGGGPVEVLWQREL